MNILQGGSLKNMVNKIYFIEKLSIIISLSILFFSIFYIKNGNACSAVSLNVGCNGMTRCGPVFSSGWWFLGVCIGGDGSWVCDSVGGYDCTWTLCGVTPCSICSGKQWVYDWASTSACPTGVGTNGGQCEVRGGNCCDTATIGTWDRSEGKCISCSGKNENVIYGSPSGIYGTSGTAGDNECESACGASADCDEKCRSTIVSSSVYCDSSCNSVTCVSSRNCAQVDDNEVTWCTGGGSVGGYKYCTYDGSSWAWRSSYPTENCCDGVDNDCDGYTDIADSDCSGRCCSDSDCPSQNNIKGVCSSNICIWPACASDSDCTSGLCYCGGSACYSSFTSASCSAGYCCNRGYGGSGIGSCVYQGTIYSNNYLCDP